MGKAIKPIARLGPPRDDSPWEDKLRRCGLFVIWLIALPFVLLTALLVIAAFALIIAVQTPFARRQERRNWRIAQRDGHVLPWPEVRDRLNRGEGLLALDVGPKGHIETFGYFLPARLSDLDPQGLCPRFTDFEGDPRPGWAKARRSEEEMETWAQANLLPRLGAARFVEIPKGALRAELTEAAKREGVIMIDFDNSACVSAHWIEVTRLFRGRK